MNKRILLLGIGCLGFVLPGGASTSINSSNAYAYGANIGWLNLRGDVANGARIGRFFSDGYIWSPNVGWIRMGSGTPENGWSYANNSESDWGVNHDGEGELSGYAYGANIGWVNFGHGQEGYEPRIDLMTGDLSGYVWGANVGWISLANSQAYVQSDFLVSGPDGTVSGVPAAWEAMMAGQLEGLSDEQIRLYYTWGQNPDTPSGARITWIEQVLTPVEGTRVVWPTSLERQYLLEISGDLMDPGAWEDSGFGILQGVSGAIARTVEADGSTLRFFRIRPIVPLAP